MIFCFCVCGGICIFIHADLGPLITQNRSYLYFLSMVMALSKHYRAFEQNWNLKAPIIFVHEKNRGLRSAWINMTCFE